MLPAVILAAGDSVRMGRPKALLPAPGGHAFVVRIVRVLGDAGVRDIVIVTGALHDAIAGVLQADAPLVTPRLVRNPDPARGQLSSLWVGMDAVVTGGTEGLLVTLVDVPMVSATAIQAVLHAWRRTRAPIVRPAIGARHGHPVVFDRQVLAELRQAPLDAGAKAVVRAHADAVLDVPVGDEGCLLDVDTPGDYARLWESPPG